MSSSNIEIKARCPEPDKVRYALRDEGAEFKGTDNQVDTYFKVPKGRLKLREGNIESNLIQYNRPDNEGPKKSEFTVFTVPPGPNLRGVLINSLEILAVVDKQREIYFIDNVKFHIDQVQGLGSFVEIEAIDINDDIGSERLMAQCQHYIKRLGIQEADFISQSYSDMVLAKK